MGNEWFFPFSFLKIGTASDATWDGASFPLPTTNQPTSIPSN